MSQVAIGLLRQQLPPGRPGARRGHPQSRRGQRHPGFDHRPLHGALPDLRRAARARPRVEACFEAGALASGCTVAYEELSPVYSHMETDPEPAGGLPGQRGVARPPLRGRRRRHAAPHLLDRHGQRLAGRARRSIRSSGSRPTGPSTTRRSSPRPASPPRPTPPCATAPWPWPGRPSTPPPTPSCGPTCSLGRDHRARTSSTSSPDARSEFLAAMEQAKALIAASPGSSRCGSSAASSDRAAFCCWSSGNGWRTTPRASGARPPTRSGAPRCTTSTTPSRRRALRDRGRRGASARPDPTR